MPLYEYRCNDCHATFELLRPMAERSGAAVCPSCESRSSMPLISRVAATVPGGTPWPSAPGPQPSGGGGGCCGGSCGCG